MDAGAVPLRLRNGVLLAGSLFADPIIVKQRALELRKRRTPIVRRGLGTIHRFHILRDFANELGEVGGQFSEMFKV